MENDYTPPKLQNTELQDADSLKDMLQADIESYLMTTYSWHMTPEKIEQNFREILSVLDTEPIEVADCLSHLNRSYFIERLTSRGVFTQGDIQAIATQLDTIRLEKILAVHQAQEHEIAFSLRQQIEIYLIHAPKEHLLSDSVLLSFQALLENETDHETLSQSLKLYNRQEFRHILMQRARHRQDIIDEDLEPILDVLEATRDAILLKFNVIHEEPSSEVISTEKSSPESIQGTSQGTRSVSPVSNWSTWNQVKLKPTEVAQQSNLSSLSWSTWAQLGQKPNVEPSVETESDDNDSSAC